MRVMLDTNVLLSIAIFRSKALSMMLSSICESSDQQLVLSSYCIGECYEVAERKKPALIPALDRFFEAISFEMIHTPQTLPEHDWFSIRDKDDEKVLYSAIAANVDVLVTGDKDFADIPIEKPEILTPHEFIQRYLLRNDET